MSSNQPRPQVKHSPSVKIMVLKKKSTCPSILRSTQQQSKGGTELNDRQQQTKGSSVSGSTEVKTVTESCRGDISLHEAKRSPAQIFRNTDRQFKPSTSNVDSISEKKKYGKYACSIGSDWGGDNQLLGHI